MRLIESAHACRVQDATDLSKCFSKGSRNDGIDKGRGLQVLSRGQIDKNVEAMRVLRDRALTAVL